MKHPPEESLWSIENRKPKEEENEAGVRSGVRSEEFSQLESQESEEGSVMEEMDGMISWKILEIERKARVFEGK